MYKSATTSGMVQSPSQSALHKRSSLSEAEAAALMQSESALHSGWLQKRGGKTRAWKKRWFVLRRGRFAYYKDQNEYESRKVVQIEDISAVTSKVNGKHVDIMFYIHDKDVRLRAETQEAADAWVEALKAAKSEVISFSAPTSPININRSGTQEDLSRSNIKTTGPALRGGMSSSGSPPRMQLFASPSQLPFSDDDHTGSDEDFTSPLSEATTLENTAPGDYMPSRLVNERADHDKVVCQSYLRRHYNSRRRGSANQWAVLRPYGLYLYPDHKEYRPLKIVPIAEIIDASDLPSKLAAPGTSHPSRKPTQFKFQVVTKEKALRFSVDQETQLDDWVGALKSRLEIEELKVQT